MAASPNKRRETDIMQLVRNDHQVELVNDGMQELFVIFYGPENSLYRGGVWKVRVMLPESYPSKPPSIRFVNKIFHPNIDERSGIVCLDVLNQDWSHTYDLVNVFELFLPQLLVYPNPEDPLNGDAGTIMYYDLPIFYARVREYCARYAKSEDAGVVSEVKSSEEKQSEDASGSADEAVGGAHVDP